MSIERMAFGLLALGMVSSVGASARAWDPFLVENGHVATGNERLAARDAAGALEQYDLAARELPDRAEVHLNRGLALLEAGELDRAREAFLLATQPPAPTDVRADAYYDLGLAFYRQADTAAQAEDHREAQRLFREAADAFRQSLRQRPGFADAGWNLELALRRIQEQQEEQEQQEQQEQEQQQQDQQDQQQQDQQDQQQQDQQDQQQQDQQQQQQDQQQQDQQQQQQDQQDPQDSQNQDSQDSEGQDPESDDSADDEQRSEDEGQQGGDSQGDSRDTPEQPPPSQGTQDGMAPEHRRVLDALEQGEDNLERHRARARAAQERRRVERDW